MMMIIMKIPMLIATSQLMRQLLLTLDPKPALSYTKLSSMKMTMLILTMITYQLIIENWFHVPVK